MLIFEIETDFEFYCYLKANLPKNYNIVSEPSTAYYSEWDYHYLLFRNGKLLSQFRGNFKKNEKGSLIRQAEDLLEDIRKTNVNRQ